MTAGVASGTRSGLGSRYRKLWTAGVISNLGDGIGAIAYPWLASAVTRNPVLIAVIAVVQRLPWLLFTLPAGVLTDRLDRRRIIVGGNLVMTAVTLVVALAVLGTQSGLPGPGDVAGGAEVGTNVGVYLVLVASALVLGMAEVLRDNAAQTFLPAIVRLEDLERGNGRLWAAELAANSFVGPPIGSLLLGIGFAVPFFVDAGTFAVAAGLVFLIGGTFRAETGTGPARSRVEWRSEMKEGFLWLWRHPLLRPMAVILGMLNALTMAMFATFVLFAQEDLDLETGLFTGVLGSLADALGFETVGALVFAVLMMGGALGGVLGGLLAPRLTAALGSGPSLYTVMIVGSLSALVIGMTSRWWLAFIMFAAETAGAILWNVITVSLRQTIIPDHLLGRVNSVYRFFGWGMMPLGSALGGVVVAVGTGFVDRSVALRLPFFVVAAAHLLLLVYAAPRLTTAKIEAARADAAGSGGGGKGAG
jgi:MFS family permease